MKKMEEKKVAYSVTQYSGNDNYLYKGTPIPTVMFAVMLTSPLGKKN